MANKRQASEEASGHVYETGTADAQAETQLDRIERKLDENLASLKVFKLNFQQTSGLMRGRAQ